jgi:hypothetical protein
MRIDLSNQFTVLAAGVDGASIGQASHLAEIAAIIFIGCWAETRSETWPPANGMRLPGQEKRMRPFDNSSCFLTPGVSSMSQFLT